MRRSNPFSTHAATRGVAALAATALLLGSPVHSGAQEVTLLAGGDIEWSRIVQVPEIFLEPTAPEPGDWPPIPYVNAPDQRDHLESLGRTFDAPESHHIRALQYGLDFNSETEMARYPFQRLADVLRGADITFANLETPLSDRARRIGAFQTPEAFAKGLRWAGIDVVSTANNHSFDSGAEGLLDTQAALTASRVGLVGTGRNLDDARRPFIIERNGVRVGFLGYTWAVNMGTWAFATPDRSGAAPLDPFLIETDIERLRDRVDYVVLSFHWGIENDRNTHPKARDFAHRMIDAGADVILGHHPHVPRGVEVYRGKVIFYSLGNLIFGHNHTYWMDNYLAELTLTEGRVREVELIPVAGRDEALSQPYVLEGAEAASLLQGVVALSEDLDTHVSIEGARGIIRP